LPARADAFPGDAQEWRDPADKQGMSRSRFPVKLVAVVVCCLAAVALVAGIGVRLADTHAAARDEVHQDFSDRSRLAADLAGGTLTSSDAKTRQESELVYAAPASALKATIGGQHAGIAWLVVLRADGSVVAADPPALAAQAKAMAASDGFATAMETGSLRFGDVAVDATGAVVQAFQPFTGSDGPRVVVLPVPVEQIAAVTASALDVTASRAYLLDGRNNIIVSSEKESAGQPMPQSALFAAAGRAQRGVVGDDFYVSNPVLGTDWRVIIATSENKLLAPLRAAERAAWQLFGAFAAAITLLLVIAGVAFTSLFRLAHARAHDALTGLPSRTLFIDRTESVIAEQRRQPSGPLAALFIDLDGFKPINDTYGHAVGDALLKAVAVRLMESLRPGDYVSRFGGDEFMILCEGLRHESDAHAVAERIRLYVAEPFDVAGHKLQVGTSIGIALVDDHAHDAASLIHNADLAMYQAKRNGKGRIEQFTADMATAAAG
jgi:diguanylate cyclase (GGDEF)-like protein